MTYLSLDDLYAYRKPEPLEEDFELPELGGSVHIKGVTDKDQLEAIHKTIANMSEKPFIVIHPATGARFTADKDDVKNACWAAACVTEPPLTPMQWLNFAAEGFSILGTLFIRSIVCSRLMPDPATITEDQAKNGVPIPGVEAAKEELKDNDADPLASGSGGDPSASGD